MSTDRKTTIDPLEAEINAIRIKLYEQTKDMSAQEGSISLTGARAKY